MPGSTATLGSTANWSAILLDIYEGMAPAGPKRANLRRSSGDLRLAFRRPGSADQKMPGRVDLRPPPKQNARHTSPGAYCVEGPVKLLD